MKKLWVHREIDAPATVLWRLLTDLDRWPEWGPSVRRAALHDDEFGRGATGRLSTVAGIDVRFEITDFAEGSSWGWKVAGIPATHHTVESLGAHRCRVGFGVPVLAAPYLAVCDVALRRLDAMASSEKVNR